MYGHKCKRAKASADNGIHPSLYSNYEVEAAQSKHIETPYITPPESRTKEKQKADGPVHLPSAFCKNRDDEP